MEVMKVISNYVEKRDVLSKKLAASVQAELLS
jgi:hypothetical protein